MKADAMRARGKVAANAIHPEWQLVYNALADACERITWLNGFAIGVDERITALAEEVAALDQSMKDHLIWHLNEGPTKDELLRVQKAYCHLDHRNEELRKEVAAIRRDLDDHREHVELDGEVRALWKDLALLRQELRDYLTGKKETVIPKPTLCTNRSAGGREPCRLFDGHLGEHRYD